MGVKSREFPRLDYDSPSSIDGLEASLQLYDAFNLFNERNGGHVAASLRFGILFF